MKIALDLGFGWTKVCTDTGKCFKFPTWLAYYSNDSIGEVDRVVVDGREYVVGEDARIERQKITIAGIQELLNYFPVFKKYVLEKLNVPENEAQIITGLPPAHKDKAKILEKMGATVLPQGVGIFLDIADKIDTSEVLIFDIGFNTVDYILVLNGKKKKGRTIEKQGIERMIELFRDKLPDELSYLKRSAFQTLPTLMRTFEKGYAVIEGEKIDLTPYKERAIEEYNEHLQNKLKSEVGNLISEIEQIVVAGGGAYYLKNLRKAGIYVPEKPEFSQARGYLKAE